MAAFVWSMVFRLLERTQSREVFIVGTVGVCFSVCALAERKYLNFSYSPGVIEVSSSLSCRLRK